MISLIQYGAGNTASVANALTELNVEYKITNREIDICKADKIIFPGVGEASYAIKMLQMSNLYNLLRLIKKPLLGICLGAQLLCNKTTEGDVNCLGAVPTTALKFDNSKVKVPHMGWNKIKLIKESKLFDNIKDGEYFYFAHSFYIPLNQYSIATSYYQEEFCSAIEKDNFYGVQFHPEKSGKAGIQILKNFIEKC